MRKTILYLVATLMIATGASTLLVRIYPSDSLKYASLKIAGQEREFYYYIPRNVSAHPKILFLLHSGNMVARDMQLITGHQFNDMADKYNDMIVVYPQAIDRRWNDCRVANDFYPKYHNVDDVAFFEKMISYFTGKYGADKENVYAAGYAAGAQMCFKLAKQKPELFKGFASICGNLPGMSNDDCYETNMPASMLIINGTADTISPYNGGRHYNEKGRDMGYMMSTNETITYFVNLDQGDTGLKAEYQYPNVDENDKTTVAQYYYPCNKTGKKVMLVKVENGGHTFPNPVYNLWPKKMGNATHDINAAEVTMDFFRSL